MSVKNFSTDKKAIRFRKKHKIGLCLSGGGTRGLAYIGVFKAFEEYGITFDAVAGTSIGSLFAALYACGMSSEDMHSCAIKAKNSDFRKAKLGFLPSSMARLNEKLNQILPIKQIENLKMEYYAVAVDLRTGKEIHFNEGDLPTIITGSCAIPGVFLPVKYEDMVLIDGGVRNNIPVDVLRQNGCDIVITVDCNSTRGGGTDSNNIITQFITSVGIMMVNNSIAGLKNSDLIIKPNMRRFNSLKLFRKNDMINEGYRATISMMQEIENILTGKLRKR